MSKDDKAVRRAVEHMRSVAGKPYLPQPIPNALDRDITAFVDAFVQGNPAQRKGLAAMVEGKPAGLLRTYAERMASLGARQDTRAHLLRGLVALGIAGFWGDMRDDLPILSLCYAAAVKIDVDPAKLFEEAAALAHDEEVKEQILAFLLRAPEDKTIEAMGYEEQMAPDGFRYHRSW